MGMDSVLRQAAADDHQRSCRAWLPLEQHPAGMAAPVRDDPEGADDVRPSQALPLILRRRRETRLRTQPAMQTVSESVSKTVSAGYPRIIPNSEGILWRSTGIWIEFNQKKANVGTNPTPSATCARRHGAVGVFLPHFENLAKDRSRLRIGAGDAGYGGRYHVPLEQGG